MTMINQDLAKGLLVFAYAASGDYKNTKALIADLINSGYSVRTANDTVLMRNEKGNGIFFHY